MLLSPDDYMGGPFSQTPLIILIVQTMCSKNTDYVSGWQVVGSMWLVAQVLLILKFVLFPQVLSSKRIKQGVIKIHIYFLSMCVLITIQVILSVYTKHNNRIILILGSVAITSLPNLTQRWQWH